MTRTLAAVGLPSDLRQRSVYRVVAACLAALTVVATGGGLIATPAAAAGETSTFYGPRTAGLAVRLAGESSDRSTGLYGLNGTPSGANSSGYSLDIASSIPVSNTVYTESTWPIGVPAPAAAAQGEIEWILKHSYPEISETDLRVAAGLGSYLSVDRAIAATQAAVWHFTNGVELDTFRRPDIAAISTFGTTTTASGASLASLTTSSAPGWTAAAPGVAEFQFALNASLVPTSIDFTSLAGASAGNAPKTVRLYAWNAATSTWVSRSSWTLSGTGSSNGNEFTGVTSQTKTWTGNWVSGGYSAAQTYRVEITPKDSTKPVSLAGIKVNAANEYLNDSAVVAVYRYLVGGASGASASSLVVPTIDVRGRAASAISAGELVGPFTLAGTAPATVSLSGSTAPSTRVVNEGGQDLTGELAPGTQFWLKDTRALSDAGSVTITATSSLVTARTVITRTGLSGALVKSPLTGLRTVSGRGTDVLETSWAIDPSSSGSVTDAPAETLRDFQYYYPAIQSPTEGTLIWPDGTRTTTDLYRLRGDAGTSADAYSIDFTRNVLLQNRAYAEKPWSQGGNPTAYPHEGAVAWILSHSYPQVGTAELSTTLRAANPSFGSANLKSWNAIAATQAAIWYFSDGVTIDRTRLGVPRAVSASSTAAGNAAALIEGGPTGGWTASEEAASVTFSFPLSTQISSYTVTSADGGSAESAPSQWHLQRSVTGEEGTWTDVSSSAVTLAPGSQFTAGASQSKTTVLGGSATYGSGNGYGYYRLVIDHTAGAAPAQLGRVTFTTPQPSVNDPQILALTEYLISHAEASGPSYLTPAPTLDLAGPSGVSVAEGDLVGPFTVQGGRALVEVSGDGGRGVTVVDEDGAPLPSELDGGTVFYLTSGALAGQEAYDGASVSVTLQGTGVVQNRLAARALVTSAGSGETLTVLGTASARATDALLAEWTIAPSSFAAISLSEDFVGAGESVVVHGAGYRPHESVDISLGSPAISLGVATADDLGEFTATVIAPDAAQGPSIITATGLSSARAATASLHVAPARAHVSVSRDFAGIGEEVDVSGSGFRPGETVSIALPQGGTPVGTAVADGSGAFTVPVSIPTVDVGVLQVAATGATSARSAFASLTVGPRVASLTLATDFVGRGETLGVTGTGFRPGESVTISLDEGGPVLATVTTDGGGRFAASPTVPAAALGAHRVVATGNVSGRVADASALIGLARATLGTDKDFVSVGESLTLDGAGFRPHEVVRLFLEGAATPFAVIAAGPEGSLVASTALVGATSGIHTVRAVGDVSARSASVDVAVGAVSAKVAVSARTPAIGDVLVVTGDGFRPGEEVKITLHSDPVLLATLSADGFGAFSTRVTVPLINVGPHSIEAVGTTTARSASAPLTVVASSGPGFPETGPLRGAGSRLASTGTEPLTVVLASLVCLGVGLSLVAARRREGAAETHE